MSLALIPNSAWFPPKINLPSIAGSERDTLFVPRQSPDWAANDSQFSQVIGGSYISVLENAAMAVQAMLSQGRSPSLIQELVRVKFQKSIDNQ